jgi:hypothetical protein
LRTPTGRLGRCRSGGRESDRGDGDDHRSGVGHNPSGGAARPEPRQEAGTCPSKGAPLLTVGGTRGSPDRPQPVENCQFRTPQSPRSSPPSLVRHPRQSNGGPSRKGSQWQRPALAPGPGPVPVSPRPRWWEPPVVTVRPGTNRRWGGRPPFQADLNTSASSDLDRCRRRG